MARDKLAGKEIEASLRNARQNDCGAIEIRSWGSKSRVLFACSPHLAKHLCGLLARHEANGWRFSVFNYILVGTADEALVAKDYRLSYRFSDCGIVADDIGGSGYQFDSLRLP
jgi:hypothetical protein